MIHYQNIAMVLCQGITVGLLITAPVGPINVLCLQRTLTNGRLSGLISGLGAATADTIYGAIAGFGVSWIANFIINQQFWFRLLGGVLVGYWGVKIFVAQPKLCQPVETRQGLRDDYISTFLLTLTNPMTVLAFAATFSGFNLVKPDSYLATFSLIAGVFLGAQLWWCIVALGGSLFRDYCNRPHRLQIINQVAGVILLVLAVTALISLW